VYIMNIVCLYNFFNIYFGERFFFSQGEMVGLRYEKGI
jgi:hypothetical protein